MDRDTLQDDLDLILAPSRDAQLPGEWDWEPPLGTVAPVAIRPRPRSRRSRRRPTRETEDGSTDDEDEEDD